MFKNISIIKSFYKLSKVKTSLIFFMFLTLIIPALLSIWTPILVSNTITAITVYDFDYAINQTIIEFVILAVSAVSYFVYHLLSCKINKIIIMNFHEFVYTNAKSNEKIKNINLTTIQDINSCVVFNKNLIYKLCFFIKSIIILIIILRYSFFLSISIILVSIISFFLLRLTNKKIQYKNQELSKYELESLNLFNSIHSGEKAEENYNLKTALKDKYFKYVDENIKTTNSISLYYNINNNFITFILKLAIFLSTIFLITQVKETAITLSVYLILTPYLTSSAENLISFFEIFPEIAIMDNTLKEFESLKFVQSPKQEIPIKINSFNLYYYNVSLGENIKPINLKINHKSSICFISSNDSALQTLSSILTQNQSLHSGCIFLDDKNISTLPRETINQLVAAVSTNEHFFNLSLYENLYFVCPSRKKIFSTIKQFELQEMIDNLPEKINTIYSSNISQNLCFFLGILRGFLSGAKIINIISIPKLNKNEIILFKKILQKLKSNCTVICYFNDEKFTELFDEILNLDN